MPCETSTSAPTTEIGNNTYSTVRTTSCQKLPKPLPLRPTIPRISATATQMPTAAEAKFCTVSPAIWLKYVSVVSPP